MADITVSADTSIIAKLLDSLNYPWRYRIDPDKQSAPSGEAMVEATILGPATEPVTADEQDGLIGDLIDAYLAESEAAASGSDDEAALAELLSPYIGKGGDKAGIRNRMAADANFQARFSEFLARALKFRLEWVEIELKQRPDAALGNPVVLGRLKIAVRAKGRGCVRVFGRDFCVSVTSLWVNTETAKARVKLDANDLKVRAHASVSDADIVITVLGVRVRIGVTGLMNDHLKRQAPVLVDLSAVRIHVPGLERTYAPTSLAVPDSPSTTTLVIDGTFSA